jgi:hypothetical protein
MSLTALVGSLLVAVVSGGSATPASEDLAAYESARAKVGRDAEAHIRLALWCERRGLEAERARHLALAVLIEPGNVTARGLLGLVKHEGKWEDPAKVGERIRADPALAATLDDYRARRARAPGTADGQWKLALWCGENGLEEEATAHLTAVTRLDPSREAAWKRLGYNRSDGRWMTADQAAALKAEREAQAAADREWTPRLQAWRAAIGRPDDRSEAEGRLAAVSDPRAVPSIRRVFASGGAGNQMRAVAILGRIDGPAASQTLAALAVWGETPEVRRAAGETLCRRDPREFVVGLINLVLEPLKYQALSVGAIGHGSPGFVAVEGRDAVLQTIFTIDESFWSPALSPRQFAKGLRQVVTGGYARRVAFQNARLASLVASVEQTSAVVNEMTSRTTAVLRAVTGHDAGTDADAWMAWWADQQGYVYQGPAGAPQPAGPAGPPPPGQVTQPYVRRPPIVQPRPKPVLTSWVHFSCFAAGTPVHGIDGPLPIERVRVGDRVLTQDTGTGLLSFQPIVAVYHNPPSATLRIDLGGDPVIATGIHRFWSPDRGWVMARELKPGDRVRTVGGLVTVRDVQADLDQLVYNLEVARGGSFFVGRCGALVHDNSLVRPVERPFDTAPELVVASHSK